MALYDAGDTAWILVCTLLVLLMSVGLSLLHAGFSRATNALSSMMLVLASVLAVSVTWVLVGFSLAFGPDRGSGLFGGVEYAGLSGIGVPGALGNLSVPPIAFAMFEMAVAVFAGAVVTGIAAGRIKFGAMLVFLILWSVLVYPTVAHWVWGQGGWLAQWGVLDFGGGTVVGLTAGASALGLTVALGPRREWREIESPPHSLPLALTGAGLLWVGWIGLATGAALHAGGVAASAALAAHLAAVGGISGWLLLDKRIRGIVSASGAAWGAVAGLAAITPAAGFLDPFASLLLGFAAGAFCSLAVGIGKRVGFDDPLRAVGVHYFAAAAGVLFVGLFARLIEGDHTEGVGVALGGGWGLMGKQAVAVVSVTAFAFAASIVIAGVLRAIMGLRVTPGAEEEGTDRHQHGEGAYSAGLAPDAAN